MWQLPHHLPALPNNFQLRPTNLSPIKATAMTFSGLLTSSWKFNHLLIQNYPISMTPSIHLTIFFSLTTDHSGILPHQFILKSSTHASADNKIADFKSKPQNCHLREARYSWFSSSLRPAAYKCIVQNHK